jgi:hypothetical protein
MSYAHSFSLSPALDRRLREVRVETALRLGDWTSLQTHLSGMDSDDQQNYSLCVGGSFSSLHTLLTGGEHQLCDATSAREWVTRARATLVQPFLHATMDTQSTYERAYALVCR